MAVPPTDADVKGATAYDRLVASAREALGRRPLLPWERQRMVGKAVAGRRA
jgi:hypothetical protein